MRQAVHTVEAVRKWSVNANPGDSIIYHTGNLFMDIELAKSSKRTADVERMSSVRDLVYGMSQSGLLHLTQQMVAPGGLGKLPEHRIRTFLYIATRSSMRRPG